MPNQFQMFLDIVRLKIDTSIDQRIGALREETLTLTANIGVHRQTRALASGLSELLKHIEIKA